MKEKLDLEEARREELRWILLRTLDSARPIGASETIIRNSIDPCIPDLTIIELRRELDYLEDRGLLTIERDRPIWFVKINWHGVQIVEYKELCLPGIARPKRW
jgi:hypothetical protein